MRGRSHVTAAGTMARLPRPCSAPRSPRSARARQATGPCGRALAAEPWRLFPAALLIWGLGFAPAAAAIGGTMVVAVWWLAGRYLAPTPVGMGLRPDGDDPAAEVTAAPVSPGEARPPLPAGAAVWRDRRFATLEGAFALGLFAQIGLVAHLFSLLAPALGAAGAGAAVSLTTACAVLGRTLLGALLPARADRRIAAAANFGVQVAGSLALLASGGVSVPRLLAGCVLFGLGVGNMI